MDVYDMVRGLVRAAELKERDDSNFQLWDDDVMAALTEARARGWGMNRTGSLDGAREHRGGKVLSELERKLVGQ